MLINVKPITKHVLNRKVFFYNLKDNKYVIKYNQLN
jgi:hypothetical protein